MSRRAEKAIDKLLNQLSHLTQATESNNQISRLIFKEVSAESKRQNRQHDSHMDFSGKSDSFFPIKEDGSNLRNLIKSQSQILEEHKMLLSDVELASKELRSRKSVFTVKENTKFSSDLRILIEQFIDGISEYQNMVSILIHQNDHIEKKILNSKLSTLNFR